MYDIVVESKTRRGVRTELAHYTGALPARRDTIRIDDQKYRVVEVEHRVSTGLDAGFQGVLVTVEAFTRGYVGL